MKLTRTVEISQQEIIEQFISQAEDCTIAEARELIKKAEINYDIKESVYFDRGTFKRELKTITITY